MWFSLLLLFRKRLLTVGGIAVIAAFHAAPALPQPENALSLDQSLQLAVQRSKQVAATDAQVGSARQMAVAAGQLPDPVLGLGVNNLPVDGPDQFSIGRDFMTMRSVGVNQEFTREEKRKARADRFAREAQTGEAQRELVITNVRRDAALAWLSRSYQESMRALLETEAQEIGLQVAAVETAYRTGRGTQADVFAARSQMEQVRDRISQTERMIATALTQLARWVGDAANQPLGPRPPMDTLPLQLNDLDSRLAHHPQIAVLEGQEAEAAAEAAIARANEHPDMTWGVMYSQRGSSFSNLVSINVAIPLQWDQKNRQERELAAKLAQVEQARARREEELRMHVAEARAMIQEWENNRSRLARFDQSLIPLAQERTRASLAAYREGNTLLITVLDARRNEIDTRVDRLQLELETARLWAQLSYLVPEGQRAPSAAQ